MRRKPVSSSRAGADAGPVLPEPATPAERRAERATLALYGFFFLFWSAGLCLGLLGAQDLLLGLPLWFTVGGVFSYAAVCLLLVRVVRRYFA